MRKVLFILGQLSDEDVAWIAQVGRRVDAAPGQVLIDVRRRVEDLVIVLDGHVEVLAGSHVLARLGRGEVLGEMSLIEDAMPSADARAVGAATLLLVSIAVLRGKLEADTAFAARFFKAVALFLADRMRSTIRQFSPGVSQEGAPQGLDDLDELDDAVMDRLHLAGQRFLMVLDRTIADVRR